MELHARLSRISCVVPRTTPMGVEQPAVRHKKSISVPQRRCYRDRLSEFQTVLITLVILSTRKWGHSIFTANPSQYRSYK
jgi:hypothetical protein